MIASKPIRQFRGLIPLLDSKKPETPFVVDGRNFTLQPDGPISSFGRREILTNAIIDPIGVYSYGILNNTKTLFLTRQNVLEYDNVNRRLIPLVAFPTPTPTDIEPWTRALVGNKEYFARKGIGLVEFDPATSAWTIVAGASIPNNICACCESAGRLVVLAEGLYAWSAIDDGRNMTPDTATGAGAQSLSIIGATHPDAPLIVWSYSNGFLVYTTKGIIRAESVLAANPFRHTVLSSAHIPLSALTVIPLDETRHVLLTRAGFFTTDGGSGTQGTSRSGVPIPYQEIMGEFFHRDIIPNLNTAESGAIRLSVDHLQRNFAVSISQSSALGIYSKAYTLYLPSSTDWGSFDKGHTAFLTVQFTPGADIVTSGLRHCQLDQNGDFWLFQGGSSDLEHPTEEDNVWVYDYRGDVEWPARNEFGSYLMPTVAYLRTTDVSNFFAPDVYDRRKVISQHISPAELDDSFDISAVEETLWDADVLIVPTVWDNGATRWDVNEPTVLRSYGQLQAGLVNIAEGPAEHLRISLDAFVEVGTFRILQEDAIDYLTQFHKFSISTLEGDIEETRDDWNNRNIPAAEDWNNNGLSFDTFEDWGDGGTAFNEYTIVVRGTIDGQNTWLNQETIPELTQSENKTRYYSMNVSGLYHLVRLNAFEPDNSFSLKTMELNMNLAGRLQ